MYFVIMYSLRSRCLEVVDARKDGRTRGIHARGEEDPSCVSFSHTHSFFFFFFFFFFLIYSFTLTNNKLNTSKKWQKTEKKNNNNNHINWEESSRLKANSEVDTCGPFFLFLSLLFPYSFVFFVFVFVFFPWVKGHSQNQTKHKRDVEKKFIFN